MLTDIKMCWIISVGVVQLAAPTFINIYNFFPTHPNIVLLVASGKSYQRDFGEFTVPGLRIVETHLFLPSEKSSTRHQHQVLLKFVILGEERIITD